MSHYNRTNPFLYILDESNDELIYLSQQCIKREIIFFVLSVLLITASVIDTFFRNGYVGLFVIEVVNISVVNGYIITQLRKTINQNKSFKINKIKYPENMTYVFINNEQLFQDALDVNVHIGKLDYLSNSSAWICVLTITVISYHVTSIILSSL